MKKNILLTGLLLLFLTAINSVSAQTSAIIKGRVFDQATNEAMPFVNVVEIDAKGRFISGVVSDINGNYILKVRDVNDSVQVSFIGYKKSVFSIENRTKIDIALEQESQALEAVKIVANKMGNDGTTSIRDRATAVQRLELKDMKSVMSTTVEEMMQGRMGNVDITAVSGDPGSGLNIKIRGTASLNGKNQPLIVVNGIPYASNFENVDFSNADVQRFGNLIDVSPEDIESIEVLKDAGSTAVWGTAAANGVIMIKTKRGVKSKPMFEYTFKFTRSQEPDPIPMLDNAGYAQLIRDETYNYNLTTTDMTDATVALINQIDFEPTTAFNYHNYIQNTNWVKEITQIAYTQQHDFSVRGGGDKSKYNLSLGYFDDGGTVIGNRSQKLNLRSSLDYDLSSKLKFTSDIMFTRYNDNNNYDKDAGGEWDSKQVRSMAYKRMPNIGVYAMDLNGVSTGQYFNDQTLQNNSDLDNTSSYYNPVAFVNLGVNNKIKDNARSLLSVKYNILPSLLLNSTITLDIFDSKRSKFMPQLAYPSYSNVATNDFSKKSSLYTKNQLIYSPKFGDDHDFNVIGQYDTEESIERGLISTTTLSASPYLQQPVGDKNVSYIKGSYLNYRSLGLFLSVNYKFKDKYIMMVNLKEEGTSKFSSTSRWGTFPSASLAWRVSNESFMKNSMKFISDFKLRSSWGLNGNLPEDNYLYFNNYSSNSGYTYIDMAGVRPSGMELTNLRFETIEQTNLGLDLAMFNDRINIVFDVYNKKTTDLYLKDTGIPQTSGFSAMNINDGSMLNQGLEFSFDAKILKQEDFEIDFNFNISTNRNIVLSLPENYSKEVGNVLINGPSGYLYKIVPGTPMGGFFGYKYLGVYSKTSDAVALDENGDKVKDVNGQYLNMQMGNDGVPYTFVGGDAKYQDVNHDGVINALDVVYLGDTNPDYMGGGGFKIRYKNITVNSFFAFKYGAEIINETRMYAENMSGFDNQTKATNSRWRKEGDPSNSLPRALWKGPNGTYGYNWLGSDRFVEDGSFIRLKSFAISYEFDKKYCEKIKVKGLKIYTTGYNLYTWTKYSGQDPDVGTPSNPSTLVTDKNVTPPSLKIMVGLNISF
jgi:TonB-linked SusC/RagA family outer membrane protein